MRWIAEYVNTETKERAFKTVHAETVNEADTKAKRFAPEGFTKLGVTQDMRDWRD